MGYVRLKHTGDQPITLSVIKSIDGKKFEPASLRVKPNEVFLCTELLAHDYTSEFAMENGIFVEEFDMGEPEWADPYYKKWKDFERRRNALLHYLCETNNYRWWGTSREKKQKDTINFKIIFNWILEHHHKYLPKEKILKMDFMDILESLEKDGNIYYYEVKYIKNPRIDRDIVFLPPFFNLPEVKKAKKEYELPQKKKEKGKEEEIKKLTFKNGSSFEIRRKALLHYLCKEEKYYLFENGGRKFSINFESIFSWILKNHHEYRPIEQVEGMDFMDILESLKENGYIRHYPETFSNYRKIVVLESFFTLPEIKKAQKEYEQSKNKKTYISPKSKSIGFEPFPSKEEVLIELDGSIITLGEREIDLSNNKEIEKHKNSYEKFEVNDVEKKEASNNALNKTLKGNFFIALRVLLSSLDKNIGIHDIKGERKFKLIDIERIYEKYRELFKHHGVKSDYNYKKIQKMKGLVNALLRRAKVGEEGDMCIQVDSLPKKDSPNKEDGWYIIKKMNKISRDGKKTTSDGKKTRGYGKRKIKKR